jgi:hypothetical protein
VVPFRVFGVIRGFKILGLFGSFGASGGGGALINIEPAYVGTNRFPRSRGPVELNSPEHDAPIKHARWELFLPRDYDYGDFAGTMTRETAGRCRPGCRV